MSKNDPTENVRMKMVSDINSQVESKDEKLERERLTELHGKIFNREELLEKFEVLGFSAPFVVVIEKSTGKKGSLEFQHYPRFYFSF